MTLFEAFHTPPAIGEETQPAPSPEHRKGWKGIRPQKRRRHIVTAAAFARSGPD